MWPWHPSGQEEETLAVNVSHAGQLMDLQYCLTKFTALILCFFFSFWNMHFSHLFGEQNLQPGSRAWNESNYSAFWLHSHGSKRLQTFTFHLKLFLCHIWEVCCGTISPVIFRLIPNIMSMWRNPNRNHVNTNTGWNKISIQMSLNLTVVFM